jgi:hypothetical protein
MTSPRRKPNSVQGERSNEQPSEIGGDEIRDDDGLLVDEYTSEAFGDPDALDALDVPRALVDESVLEDVPDTGGGMNEVDPAAASLDEEEGDMGLGAEPRSTEELADAAIGRELRGKRAVTRDDEEHGEHLLDRAPGENE